MNLHKSCGMLDKEETTQNAKSAQLEKFVSALLAYVARCTVFVPVRIRIKCELISRCGGSISVTRLQSKV